MNEPKLEAAIAYLEDTIRETDIIMPECSPALQAELAEQRRHYVVAIEAMRTSLPDNKALTLEELREMDGEPVWVTPGDFWALVHIAPAGVLLLENSGELAKADSWIKCMGAIYCRKPEGGGEQWR